MTESIAAQHLQQLHAFLKSWQNEQNILLAPDQYLQVFRLYEHWQATHTATEEWSSFGDRLGPLLCASAQQQTAFQRAWAQFSALSTKPKASNAPSVSDHSPAQQPLPSWFDRANRQWQYRRRWTIVIMSSLLLLVLWLTAAQFSRLFEPSTPTLPPVEEPPISSGDFGSENPPGPETPSIQPPLKEVPLRQPPPQPLPPKPLTEADHAQIAQIRNILFGTLFGLMAVAAGLFWWQRKIVIKRHQQWQAQGRSLHSKAPRPTSAQIFGTQLLSTLARERFQAQDRGAIHWPKSLRASAHRGGYPSLIHKPRWRQVEVIILVDNHHLYDQTAWLLRCLHQTLQEASINTHFYDFDHHPQRLWRDGDRRRHSIALEQLSAYHPQAHLLLVVEHKVLFLRFSGRPQPWLQQITGWPSVMLALLSQPTTQQQQQLQQHKLRYRILDQQQEVTTLIQALLSADPLDKIQSTPDYPPILQAYLDPARLDNSPPSPEQTEALLKALQDYLGAAELRLLAGMAMYPKLDGDLMMALAQWLATADSTQTIGTEGLLKIVTLPWCRQGWLPQWLRQALLNHLSDSDARMFYRCYEMLFSADRKLTTSAELVLAFQRPSPLRVRSWLRQALQNPPIGSTLNDPILAQVLLNSQRWPDKLVLLARRVTALPQSLLGWWRPMAAFASLSAVLIGAAWLAWSLWGEAQLEHALLTQKNMDYATQTVVIRYTPEAQTLLEPIAQGLLAVGFQVAQQELASGTTGENRIRAPADLIAELERVATWMSWDQAFLRATDSLLPIIELTTPLRTGAVMRDRVRSDTTASSYPDSIRWSPIPSELPPPTATTIAANIPPPSPSNPIFEPILPTMIKIPAGSFLMGSPDNEPERSDSEGPQHEVTLAAFELAETEVTFAEWERCALADACFDLSAQGWGRGQQPVIGVSWDEAQAYIRWLNQTLGLNDARPYRLPTEAEWEYAARAGTTTAHYWGDASSCEYANAAQADCDDGFAGTAPVKSFQPNNRGLYDMAGNVWEWVEDCWHENYQNAPDNGQAWLETEGGDCDWRVLRGGSWFNKPGRLRSAHRNWLRRDVRKFNDLGFRLARTL